MCGQVPGFGQRVLSFFSVSPCVVRESPPSIYQDFLQQPSEKQCYFSSSEFKECHKFVSAIPYLAACLKDSCHMACSSLQAYAIECAKQGVCIDWRNATKGSCRKYHALPTMDVTAQGVWCFNALFTYILCILQHTSVQATRCTMPAAPL